MVDNLIVILG